MPKANRKTSRRNSRPPSRKAHPSSAIVRVDPLSLAEKVEQVLIGGDLSPLTPEERVDYYKKVSMSIGVNQLTRPFEYILFREPGGGAPRLQLYANKSCTEQLRKIHGVSVTDHQQTIEGDYVHVQVKVQDRTGRTDFALGSVPLFKYKDGNRFDLSGVERCNAIMKASTKAKRRATLSICGLAFLDESELDRVRVVGGVTPEGRIYHLPDQQEDEPRQLTEGLAHGHEPGSEKAKQAEAALKRVEDADRELKAKKLPGSNPGRDEAHVETVGSRPEGLSPSASSRKHLEIDLTNPEDPIVRGDTADLLPALEKHIQVTWKDDWHHIRPVDVNTLHAAGKELGFDLTEFQPVPSVGKGAEVQRKAQTGTPSAQPKTSAPQNQRKETKTNTSQAAAAGGTVSAGEPLLVKCTIERVIAGMTGNNNPLRQVTVLLSDKKKPTYGCFDSKFFPHLDKAVGKEAELFIQTRGKYTNLVGVKRLGSVEFEDGVPVIQRDREAGGKTLF